MMASTSCTTEPNLLDVEIIIKEEESSNSEDEDHVEYESEEMADFKYDEETQCDNENDVNSNFTPQSSRNKIPPPGHTGGSLYATTMAQIFKCFITPEMVDIIVEYTNQKATTEIDKWNENHPQNLKFWTMTDNDEIYAFVGLSLIIGALKARKEPIHTLWTNDPCFRRSIFQGTFSRQRFQQLSSYLRFDDATTRQERRSMDKLAPIRQIFNMFVDNCKANYNTEPNVTIDEQLIPFRGNCPFKVFKLNKPGKYGIKLWILADAITSYCKNIKIHLGRAATKDEQQTQHVILDMVSELEGGYCITSNCLAGIPLANELLNRGLKLIGPLRKHNKDNISPDLLPFEGKPVTTVQPHITLISYKAKKDIDLILLSTEKLEGQGANIITTYNYTKGAVDALNKLISEYSSNRQTKMWPKVLFMNLIDIAGINSFIIWAEKNANWHSDKRRFLLELGKELVQRHVSMRYHSTNGLQKPVIQAICQVIGEEPENKRSAVEPLENRSKKSKGRCFFCLRKKDRKTTIVCSSCCNLVCREHSTTEILCYKCQDTN